MTVISVDGTTRDHGLAFGLPLMELLRDLGQIDAVCGGGISCGTCAIGIEPSWLSRLPPAGEMEQALLNGMGYISGPQRLSCQLIAEPAIEGLIVHMLPTL